MTSSSQSPVPRGHCERCDICGEPGVEPKSGRALRHLRCAAIDTGVPLAHCPGCGAPYETATEERIAGFRTTIGRLETAELAALAELDEANAKLRALAPVLIEAKAVIEHLTSDDGLVPTSAAIGDPAITETERSMALEDEDKMLTRAEAAIKSIDTALGSWTPGTPDAVHAANRAIATPIQSEPANDGPALQTTHAPSYEAGQRDALAKVRAIWQRWMDDDSANDVDAMAEIAGLFDDDDTNAPVTLADLDRWATEYSATLANPDAQAASGYFVGWVRKKVKEAGR